ncbi:hypothetical protein HYX70_03665 [Candidatus Saccharibacteria bacterium]|nr:hypothetical protein [Candidatus Saccharibacteria bacterium]
MSKFATADDVLEVIQNLSQMVSDEFIKVGERFDSADKRFEKIEDRLDRIGTTLASIKTELAEIRSRLDCLDERTHEDTTAALEDVAELRHRLTAAEKRIEILESQKAS